MIDQTTYLISLIAVSVLSSLIGFFNGYKTGKNN